MVRGATFLGALAAELLDMLPWTAYFKSGRRWRDHHHQYHTKHTAETQGLHSIRETEL